MSKSLLGGGVRLVALGLLASAVSFGAAAPARAERSVTATPRGRLAVEIDGRLDEPAWARGRPEGGFVERWPQEGRSAPVETTFRVLYDPDALYVGVTCALLDGETPRALELRRDGSRIGDDDTVVVKLDVHRDRRTTLAFGVNAAGAPLDYLATDNGASQRFELDAVWEVATARSERAWHAELRIPFAALGLGPGTSRRVLGLNVTRMHSARAATYDWSPMPQASGGLSAPHYGELRGLRAAATGRPLTIAPHVRAAWTDVRPGRADDSAAGLVGDGEPWTASAGLDARVRLADDTWAEATLLADFSDAELDPSVVNLGRFPLFLPERRAFFTTGLEVFELGSAGEAQPFFTRRIGLDSEGRPVTVLGGAKLYGNAGPLSFGLLEATTSDPAEHFLVARARLSASDHLRVGLIALSRWRPDAARPHAAAGADFAVQAASSHLELSGYGIATRPSDDAGHVGFAAGLGARWRAAVAPSISLLWVDPDFAPEAGFVRRTDTFRARASLPGTIALGGATLESVRLSLDASMETSHDLQRRLGRSIGAGLDVMGRSGLGAGVYAGVEEELVDSPFEPLPGREVQPGTYGGFFAAAGVGLASRVNPSGQLVYELNDGFYGGTSHRMRAELSMAAGPHVRATVSGTLGYLLLPQERAAWVWTSDATLSLVPSTVLVTDIVLRANGVEQRALGMVRLRWRWAPGSDLLAAYRVSCSWDEPTTVDRSLSLSLTYRWDTTL